MIGRLIGAAIGSQAAKQAGGITGPAGAAIGMLIPTVLRRVSIPGMLAIAAGGYAYKKYTERSDTGVSGSSMKPARKSTVAVPSTTTPSAVSTTTNSAM